MIDLFVNEIRLQFFLHKRYWFETVASSIFILGLFIGLYFVVVSVTNESAGNSKLDVLVIGFVVWAFANAAYSSASKDIVEEIRQGTLEQLCLSPWSLAAIFLMRSIWHILSGVGFLAVALTLLTWITDTKIEIDWAVFLPSILLGAPSLIGLGFIVAGFSVLFKKAQTVQGILYFVLIGVISIDAWPLNVASLLPFSVSATVARSSIAAGEMGVGAVGAIALNSTVYFVLGLSTFWYLLDKSRVEGTLGHY